MSSIGITQVGFPKQLAIEGNQISRQETTANLSSFIQKSVQYWNDVQRIAAEIPYGRVTVEPCGGGLNIDSETGTDPIVVANAGIIVCFEE